MLTAILILSALILLTYLFYPAFVILLGTFLQSGKTSADSGSISTNGRVFLFMSVHNEEADILKKLKSLEAQRSSDRLVCYIGSDASSDKTDRIIREFDGDLAINFEVFEHRTGKPEVINQLVARARREEQIGADDLFFITDANVFPEPAFVSRMQKAFSDDSIGLVDGVVLNNEQKEGIAGTETSYLKWETSMKLAEGRLWGCAMGPFGGAYMIRPQLYKPVPATYLVDDFFIFYSVLQKGYKTVVVEDALCFEDISGNLTEEFKRKRRIATGNIQNTMHYLGEIVQLWKAHNVVFVFHKLLRWLTPLFGIALLILLSIMAVGNRNAQIALLIMISLLVGIPLLNYLLNQVDLRAKWLQGLSYLIIMNLAMLLGFFNFLKGVKTNVWQPTKRKQPS